VQGYHTLADGFSPFLRHQALPVLTLGLPFIALIARATRASMLDVLGQEHVRTARAKGLSEMAVLIRHGLRTAAVPIVTVTGNGFALLIGGVIVTESVFNLPGIGRLTVDAVLARDYPLIQGIILLTSGLYVGLNFIIDMLYVALDPRIRY
jgi:peptide/nickel transport system permease protein